MSSIRKYLIISIMISLCGYVLFAIRGMDLAHLAIKPQRPVPGRMDFSSHVDRNTSDAHPPPTTPPPPPPPPPSTKTPTQRLTKVLLVTYYRGGSSFLGEILGRSKTSFYWFEPLFRLVKTLNLSKLPTNYKVVSKEMGFLFLQNGSLWELPPKLSRPKTDVVAKTLMCKATDLTFTVLASDFTREGRGSSRYGPYKNCLRQTRVNKYKVCATVLERTCLNSTFVAVKVIRLAMHEVRRLKKAIPDLKIIHYIRDPRATITSRASLQRSIRQNLGQHSRILCLQMAKNQEVFEEMQREKPEDYLLLKYEDLALKPVQTAKRIYHFIGYEMPQHVAEWIEVNTKASKMDWTYGTRRNATQTVHKWRRLLKGPNLQTVTEQCRAILHRFGYES